MAARGAKPTTVRLRGRGLLLGEDLGAHVYTPPQETVEWELPPDGLSSGINEVIVETDGPVTLRSIEFIDRTKHDLSLR